MKINANSLPAMTIAQNQATATPSKRSGTTQAPSAGSKRSTFEANDFKISTRSDGAVLATANSTDGNGQPVSTAVTLVPPSTQTKGVKTFTLTAHEAYGTPSFKITPYLFDTPDGTSFAYGNESFAAGNFAASALVPIQAAIRFENDFVSGDSGGREGLGALNTYTLRAVDSVIDLGPSMLIGEIKYPTPTAGMSVVPYPSFSTLPTSAASQVPSAVVSQTSGQPQGFSKLQWAGLGAATGSMALLMGITSVLFYRRAQMTKRSEASQSFALKVLPRLDASAFNATNV